MLGAAAIAAAFLAAPVLAAAGPDVIARGGEVYDRCRGCHSLERDRTGPRHCGLFGRPAGSVPGFRYSPAMRDAQIVWNEITLDRFLADPRGAIPGNRMTYAGVESAAERAALIAWLAWANGPDGPCHR